MKLLIQVIQYMVHVYCNQYQDVFVLGIWGGADTPYESGVFELEITVPDRYPFEPPQLRFLTPIYHPNIDDVGRICLDLLKMPPHGGWKPSLNIASLLMSIQVLMAEPNPDDGLMSDIAYEYKQNRPLFIQKATAHTEKHAQDTTGVADSCTRTGSKRKSLSNSEVTEVLNKRSRKQPEDGSDI